MSIVTGKSGENHGPKHTHTKAAVKGEPEIDITYQPLCWYLLSVPPDSLSTLVLSSPER